MHARAVLGWAVRVAAAGLVLGASAAMVAGCGGGPEAEAENGAAQEATQPAAEPAAAAESLEVGAAGSVGPYSASVTEVTRLTAIDDPVDTYETQMASAGKEFLIVALELKNGTSEAYGVGPVYFKLFGSDGAEYEAFPTNTPDFIFNMPEPVPAEGTAVTKIAYEIPAGAKGFVLRWEPFVEGADGPKTQSWAFE